MGSPQGEVQFQHGLLPECVFHLDCPSANTSSERVSCLAQDIPALVAEAQAAHPSVQCRVADPIGEFPAVAYIKLDMSA